MLFIQLHCCYGNLLSNISISATVAVWGVTCTDDGVRLALPPGLLIPSDYLPIRIFPYIHSHATIQLFTHTHVYCYIRTITHLSCRSQLKKLCNFVHRRLLCFSLFQNVKHTVNAKAVYSTTIQLTLPCTYINSKLYFTVFLRVVSAFLGSALLPAFKLTQDNILLWQLFPSPSLYGYPVISLSPCPLLVCQFPPPQVFVVGLGECIVQGFLQQVVVFLLQLPLHVVRIHSIRFSRPTRLIRFILFTRFNHFT